MPKRSLGQCTQQVRAFPRTILKLYCGFAKLLSMAIRTPNTTWRSNICMGTESSKTTVKRRDGLEKPLNKASQMHSFCSGASIAQDTEFRKTTLKPIFGSI